jgi:hypothetical protein
VWVLVQLKVKEEAHIKCATTELVQSEINIETIQVIYVSYQKEGEHKEREPVIAYMSAS